MATSKTSRYQSLKKMGGANLLPPEVVRMAKQAEAMVPPAKGSSLRNPPKENPRLRHKTKEMNHDQNPDIVHKKSTLNYVPPGER